MCDHYETKSFKHGFYNYDGDWEVEDYTEKVSLNEDIDLHRYQCTRCKKIGYYSGAAVDFYEKGTRSTIEGLS